LLVIYDLLFCYSEDHGRLRFYLQGGVRRSLTDLVLAAAGRIRSAIIRGQFRFDEMEKAHQKILAGVLSCILYHRTDYE
jgi:hypothetical protein